MENAIIPAQSERLVPTLAPEEPLNTSDVNVLCQLVEACLFMHGDVISEGELAKKVGVPGEGIRRALEQLERNYSGYRSAIRVRRTHDDCWIMDLDEIVQDKATPFYVEKQQFTKAEVMTVALVAFLQPVPKHVILFYRGKTATAHLHRWVDAGFLACTTIDSNDLSIASVLDRYRSDHEDKQRERESNEDESANLQLDDAGIARKTKKRRTRTDPAKYTCFTTTSKFAGYFNLPANMNELKAELDTWKEVYGMLG